MGLKCGLVGMPNVGKSTLFNALTQAEVPAENFAFCTIDPHNGVVPIPDPRLKQIADIVKPAKITNNTMEFVDIAGLVEGASSGEGLGNQFLSHIRETDAILHILRCFEGEDINHTMANINPLRDMEIINTELTLSDLEVATKALARHGRKSDSGDKSSREICNFFETKIIRHLDQNLPLRRLELNKKELHLIADYGFLTMKPTIYVLNLRDANNCDLTELQAAIQKDGGLSIQIDIKTEAELAVIDEEERAEFLRELGLEEPALDRLIRSSYDLLRLMTFFTAGEKEVRAWNLRQGDTAVDAAGSIHTDFIKHFIRAEVVGYDDYIASGGEQGAKKNGKWRLEGKEYIPVDGDIIYFRTSA